MTISLAYFDCWPDAAMGDSFNVPEFYVDDISDLRVHGPNMTATYHRWERNGPACEVIRAPVLRIVRPVTSIIGMRHTLAQMVRSASGVIVPQH